MFINVTDGASLKEKKNHFLIVWSTVRLCLHCTSLNVPDHFRYALIDNCNYYVKLLFHLDLLNHLWYWYTKSIGIKCLKKSVKLHFSWILGMASSPKKVAPGSLQNYKDRGPFFLLFWLPVHRGLRKGLSKMWNLNYWHNLDNKTWNTQPLAGLARIQKQKKKKRKMKK